MAPKKKAKVGKQRQGKKKWFQILAPKMFNNQVLGETYLYETDQMNNKFISVNLMSLTGNPKKQNTNVSFKVREVKEGKAYTKTLGLELQPSNLKRLVHRGRSKVADSFLARTKGKELVRVKPIVLTRNRADLAVQQAMRKRVRELLTEIINTYTFETVVNDIVTMRLQKHLKEQLSKIFPVRTVEIKFFKFAKEPEMAEQPVEKTTYSKPPAEKKKPDTLQSLKAEVEEAIKTEKKPIKTKADKLEKPVEPDSEEAADAVEGSEEEQ